MIEYIYGIGMLFSAYIYWKRLGCKPYFFGQIIFAVIAATASWLYPLTIIGFGDGKLFEEMEHVPKMLSHRHKTDKE